MQGCWTPCGGWVSHSHWIPHGSPSTARTPPATRPCPPLPTHAHPAGAVGVGTWPAPRGSVCAPVPLVYPHTPLHLSSAVLDKTPLPQTPPRTQPGISFSFPGIAGSHFIIRLIKTNTWSPPRTEGLPGDKMFWLLQPQQARRHLWNSSLAPGAIPGPWRWSGSIPSGIGLGGGCATLPVPAWRCLCGCPGVQREIWPFPQECGGREGELTGDALCHDVGHLAAGREHAHAQLVHHQHLGTGEHPEHPVSTL